MTDPARLIDVDPQKSLLPDLPFHIHHFHARGAGGPLGSVADAIQLHRSMVKSWRRSGSLSLQQKSGLAPTRTCDRLPTGQQYNRAPDGNASSAAGNGKL